jgi:hypothetical protein
MKNLYKLIIEFEENILELVVSSKSFQEAKNTIINECLTNYTEKFMTYQISDFGLPVFKKKEQISEFLEQYIDELTLILI